MLVSTAWAQAAGGAPGGSTDMIAQFLPLILIFLVFYFLLLRPQQKRMKEHRAMLEAVRRGDRVVTGGGIVGTVTNAGDDELTVEIAEGVRVKVLRSTITSVLAKTEPAKGDGNGKKPADAAAPEAEQPKGMGIGRLLGRKS